MLPVGHKRLLSLGGHGARAAQTVYTRVWRKMQDIIPSYVHALLCLKHSKPQQRGATLPPPPPPPPCPGCAVERIFFLGPHPNIRAIPSLDNNACTKNHHFLYKPRKKVKTHCSSQRDYTSSTLPWAQTDAHRPAAAKNDSSPSIEKTRQKKNHQRLRTRTRRGGEAVTEALKSAERRNPTSTTMARITRSSGRRFNFLPRHPGEAQVD